MFSVLVFISLKSKYFQFSCDVFLDEVRGTRLLAKPVDSIVRVMSSRLNVSNRQSAEGSRTMKNNQKRTHFRLVVWSLPAPSILLHGNECGSCADLHGNTTLKRPSSLRPEDPENVPLPERVRFSFSLLLYPYCSGPHAASVAELQHDSYTES